MLCKDIQFSWLTKKLPILILTSMFLAFYTSVASQNSKQEKRKKKQAKKDLKKQNAVNPDYIDLIPKNKLLLGFQFGGVDNRYILRDNENKNYFQLASNIIPSVGLHFKYKRLPLISFSLPVNMFAKNSPFITKGYNFGIHFQPSRVLFIDAYFFQISGLKFNELSEIDTLTPYHHSNTSNFNLEMFFVFNHAKFSYKNAYLSGEIQKKSAGSIALGMSFSYFNQKNEDFLFSPNNEEYKTLNYQRVWGFSFASMLGYMHTFVISKHWYIGAGLFYGPNIHFGKAWYHSSQDDKVYVNVSSSIKFKFATGYNSKHILIKLIGHSGFYGYKPYKKNAFNNYISDFRLSFTYIFDLAKK